MNEVFYRLMRPLFFIACLFLSVAAYSGDTLSNKELRGYKKIFYKLVILHPKINSTFERSLLKHYLAGSGVTYLVVNSDFVKLKNTISGFEKNNCVILKSNPQYYTVKVKLDDDAYFGWALGTITCIFNSNNSELISFVDVYDFNKKKNGQRSLKSELITRVFRLMAPRSAKAFIVSYADAAYSLVPL